MGLIGLILSLVYLNHWMFLSQTESIAILPSVILILLSLGYFHSNIRVKSIEGGFNFFGLLVFSLYAIPWLEYSTNYYNSLHTGETWQQYGAFDKDQKTVRFFFLF